MQKSFLFLILLFFTGCDPGPKTGSDGYKFGQKQYTQTDLKINVVIYPDEQSFKNEIARRKIKVDNVAAFSILYVGDQSKCTIHIIDPAVNYSPEFVGHELLHCVYGQWHTNNNERG